MEIYAEEYNASCLILVLTNCQHFVSILIAELIAIFTGL